MPLAERFDVELWTPGSGWSQDVERHARVSRLGTRTPPWPSFNLAEATVYHLDEDLASSAEAWELAGVHPGVLVVHQASLLPLLRHVADSRHDPEMVRGALRRCYGEDANQGDQPLDAARFPLLGWAASRALAVVYAAPEAPRPGELPTDVPNLWLPPPGAGGSGKDTARRWVDRFAELLGPARARRSALAASALDGQIRDELRALGRGAVLEIDDAARSRQARLDARLDDAVAELGRARGRFVGSLAEELGRETRS